MGTCVRARTSGCASNIERRRDRDRTRDTAGVEGRLWSEVAVASLKHPWDNKMRLPDESGGKDRRATFDDVGCHNVTTKTIVCVCALGVDFRWLRVKFPLDWKSGILRA